MNDTKDTKLIYSILYELLYTKQRQGLVSAVRSTGPLPASFETQLIEGYTVHPKDSLFRNRAKIAFSRLTILTHMGRYLS